MLSATHGPVFGASWGCEDAASPFLMLSTLSRACVLQGRGSSESAGTSRVGRVQDGVLLLDSLHASQKHETLARSSARSALVRERHSRGCIRCFVQGVRLCRKQQGTSQQPAASKPRGSCGRTLFNNVDALIFHHPDTAHCYTRLCACTTTTPTLPTPSHHHHRRISTAPTRLPLRWLARADVTECTALPHRIALALPWGPFDSLAGS